jgi:aromatic ring hydroxylase
MNVYTAHKKWRELLAEVSKAEGKALSILRHPKTTPEQLLQVHKMLSTQAAQIEGTRRKLEEVFKKHDFFFW